MKILFLMYLILLSSALSEDVADLLGRPGGEDLKSEGFKLVQRIEDYRKLKKDGSWHVLVIVRVYRHESRALTVVTEEDKQPTTRKEQVVSVNLVSRTSKFDRGFGVKLQNSRESIVEKLGRVHYSMPDKARDKEIIVYKLGSKGMVKYHLANNRVKKLSVLNGKRSQVSSDKSSN